MADSESTKGKSGGSGSAQKQQAPPPDDPGTDDAVVLPVSQLVSDGPELLGYPRFVVAGAMVGHDQDEQIAISDAKDAVEVWLTQPVQVDPREGEE